MSHSVPSLTLAVIHALTLGADHNDRDVCAVCAQLAVELVELLEAGLVLQAEDEDHCVNPAAELQGEEGWRMMDDEVCRYFRFA